MTAVIFIASVIIHCCFSGFKEKRLAVTVTDAVLSWVSLSGEP